MLLDFCFHIVHASSRNSPASKSSRGLREDLLKVGVFDDASLSSHVPDRGAERISRGYNQMVG